MCEEENIRGNSHWLNIASKGRLAIHKEGSDLLDKDDYKDNNDVELFETNATYDIMENMAQEIIRDIKAIRLRKK